MQTTMKEEIVRSLGDPQRLEKLYRADKAAFKRSFAELYPEVEKSAVVEVWHQRLNYEQEEISWGSAKELGIVVLLALLSGFVAKIPAVFRLEEEHFFSRNIGLVVFPFLMAYFAWRHTVPKVVVWAVAGATAIVAAYVNFLPNNPSSDSLVLACIHFPLLLWALLGVVHTRGDLHAASRRLDYLKFNGDQVVMTVIILLAGGALSAITVGLFRMIGLNIEEFYFQNFGLMGASAAPIMAAYLVTTNPQLVNRVSPIIARVFTPLVLGMLVVYLTAVVYTGKDPYNDREFLLIFNVLLLGVMAIILFAVAEQGRSNGIGLWMLSALSVLTILVNSIALSAILFRISEWGITPNRLAVLGSNLLILSHLIGVAISLFRVARGKSEMDSVHNSITWFLPAYAFWTAFVVIGFPLLFGFR
jgi:hypothetical protein